MRQNWYSSYEKNNYGDLFYSLIRVFQPKKIVELGTKAGYSAYHMAQGLRDNHRGQLDCYDLWEKYPYDSVPKSVTEENLKEFKDITTFKLRNAIGVDKIYKTIDILHVDLSNDGGILEEIIPSWIDKVRQLIIIEGGSLERDKVAWMTKYNKVPIKNWLEEFKQKYPNVQVFTFEPFPSLTILKK